MDFFDVIKNRKSVREYAGKVVENTIIEKIVDAGRLAATARNEQPWEFIATSDKHKLKKISSLCPNGVFVKDASWLIAVFSKDTKYYIEDCSAATQNMLLAIQALGLGGCWVAGDKKDYADDVRKLKTVQPPKEEEVKRRLEQLKRMGALRTAGALGEREKVRR